MMKKRKGFRIHSAVSQKWSFPFPEFRQNAATPQRATSVMSTNPHSHQYPPMQGLGTLVRSHCPGFSLHQDICAPEYRDSLERSQVHIQDRIPGYFVHLDKS